MKKAALSQISALKWRVEVIQGQSFYAHWKTGKSKVKSKVRLYYSAL